MKTVGGKTLPVSNPYYLQIISKRASLINKETDGDDCVDFIDY